MRHITHAALLLTVIVSAGAAWGQTTTPASANRLATMEELQEMYAAKAYRQCIQHIARVMPPLGEPPAGYTKYALLMLRAECLVSTGDTFSARLAYESAANEAKDATQSAAARARIAVLDRAVSNKISVPGQAEGIDITTEAGRQQGMALVFGESMEKLKREAAEAQKAKSLPPIFRVGPLARETRSLELATTGKDEQTVEVVMPLAELIYELIDTDLDLASNKIAEIRRNAEANAVVSGGWRVENGRTWWQQDSVRVGLSADERRWLREKIVYLGKVNETLDQLREASKKDWGRTGKGWQPLQAKTRKVAAEAQGVLARE